MKISFNFNSEIYWINKQGVMNRENQLSPRWARLVKVEDIETEDYFVDAYCSPLPTEELIKDHLDENPIMYAFAIFDKSNNYILSYALEIREAVRINENDEEETYTGYFLETFCPNFQFSCKNFKENEPTFDAVKNTVQSYITEYDAVNKMLNYDQEVNQDTDQDMPTLDFNICEDVNNKTTE